MYHSTYIESSFGQIAGPTDPSTDRSAMLPTNQRTGAGCPDGRLYVSAVPVNLLVRETFCFCIYLPGGAYSYRQRQPTAIDRPIDPPTGRPTDRPTNLPTSHPYLHTHQVPICRPTYPTTDRRIGWPFYRPTLLPTDRPTAAEWCRQSECGKRRP